MKTVFKYWRYYLVFAAGILACVLIMFFSSYFRYDYHWIIGKHYEEIIADYGDFDSGNAEFVADSRKYEYERYYVNDDIGFCEINNSGTYKLWNPFNTELHISTFHHPHVIIEFDSSGYAVSVSKGYLFPPGG